MATGLTRRTSEISGLFGTYLHSQDSNGNNKGTWVIGVMDLERQISLEELRGLFQERIVKRFARYRSVLLMEKSGEFHFVEQPELDLEYHISEAFEPGSTTWSAQEVEAFVGELNTFPWDMKKPLWRVTLVPNLNDGKCAIVWVTNHVIGDGIALVEVLYHLLDTPEENGNTETKMKHQGKRTSPPPLPLATRLAMLAYGFWHGLLLPLKRADPPNALKLKDSSKPHPVKSVARADYIEMSKVLEIQARMPGTTINDILMAVLTLTVKAFFVEDGSFNPKNKVSGQFPISMRAPKESPFRDGEPHNDISYGYYDFDMDATDRVDCVWRTKFQADLIKVSPSPLVVQKVLSLGLRLLPSWIMVLLTLNVANLGTAQLSNVPGPRQTAHINGIPVSDMSFYLFSPLGFYIGILSYDGKIAAAVNLDSGLGVEAKEVAKHWKPEFEKLYEEVMARDLIKPPVQDILPSFLLLSTVLTLLLLTYLLSKILL